MTEKPLAACLADPTAGCGASTSPDEDCAAEQIEQQHQEAAQQRGCHWCAPDLVADADIQQLVALAGRHAGQTAWGFRWGAGREVAACTAFN